MTLRRIAEWPNHQPEIDAERHLVEDRHHLGEGLPPEIHT